MNELDPTRFFSVISVSGSEDREGGVLRKFFSPGLFLGPLMGLGDEPREIGFVPSNAA